MQLRGRCWNFVNIKQNIECGDQYVRQKTKLKEITINAQYGPQRLNRNYWHETYLARLYR